MKRILFDVPRWHVYLHRDARGLDPVDQADQPLRRFEDELFDRIYSGAADRLSEADRDSELGGWAEQVHSSCEQLPAFSRLASECRGDSQAAAAAVESLMEELKPTGPNPEPPPNLRRTLAKACEKASGAVEALRDVTEGLDQVFFGNVPGMGSQDAPARQPGQVRALATRLKEDARLRRIALLAGRFKRIAAAKLRQKTRHGADEVCDIEQGADLGRMLPSELGRLLHPRQRLAFLRDFTERRCLQYQMRGSENLGKGPLVVALDKSGSMHDSPDIWATAVALALLEVAHRERRPFALLAFDGEVKFEALVRPGEKLPEAGLFVGCAGGTDIGGVIARGLDIIRANPGGMKQADIVLVTDGGSEASSADSMRATARELGVTVLGLGIGVSPEMLQPWCDEIHTVSDLSNIDNAVAEQLFTT